MNKYDAYEIHPMQYVGLDGDRRISEPVFDDTVPDFWTLFGHLGEGGVEEIADYPTRDAAIIGLMTSALANAQEVLNNMGRSRYADVDWVMIREALRFAKEKL